MSNSDRCGMTRRNVLRTTGAAMAVGSVATTASARDSPEDFEFDTVVNVVDEGADPTGEDPVDPIVDAYTQDHTLLLFPPGRYRLNQFHPGFGTDLEHFGIKGVGSGQVTFVPRDGHGSDRFGTGYADKLFMNLWGRNHLLLEGFSIDVTAENTGGRIQLLADDGLVCRDLAFEGLYDTDRGPFLFRVADEAGEGLVQNVRITDGTTGPPPHPVGVFVDNGHVGTITFRNCHVEGCQDNGLYASAPTDPGTVQVEGGVYRNNNIAQVRLGQSNSYVRNALVEITEVPTFWADHMPINMRGIRQANGAGMTVSHCDVRVSADVGSNGAIVSNRDSGGFTVENTRIHVDSPFDRMAIFANSPTGSDGFGNTIDAFDVTLRNVTITGDATGFSWPGAAVAIIDRDGNTLENVCISQPGSNRDGVFLARSDTTIRNALIDAAGESVVAVDAEVTTDRLRDHGSCPETR